MLDQAFLVQQIGLGRTLWQSAQPAYLSRFPNDPRTLDLVFAYGHFARDI